MQTVRRVTQDWDTDRDDYKICQYQMEDGSPLSDVLLEDMS